MTRFINILAVLCLCCTGVFAQSTHDATVRITNIESYQQPGSMKIDFDMQIGEKAARSRDNLTLIPVIKNGDRQLELQPVVVRGRRAKILFERRAIASPSTASTNTANQYTTVNTRNSVNAINSGNGQTVEYSATVPFEEWMEGSSLVLDGVYENCCSAVRTNLGIIESPLSQKGLYAQEKFIIPGTHRTTGDRLAEKLPYVNPMSEYGTIHKGNTTVYFHLNKYDIDQTYRDNRRTLADILAAVRELEAAPDSRVEKIVIVGHASPEGGVRANELLSQNRGNTVHKYITDHSTLTADRIEIINGGEDWDGLRELVEASDMPDKAAVMAVLNEPTWGAKSNESKKTQLRAINGGRPYRYMLENMFPTLRSAAYISVYYGNIE